MSKTTNKFSPEVRERAVRLVLDSEAGRGSRWAAIVAIAPKIGCAAQTHIPPAEAEAAFYATLETPDMAALLTRYSLRQTRRGSGWRRP